HTDEAKTRLRSYERMKEKLLEELKKTFRPEFLNRLDGVVVFHHLTKEQIREIVDLMLRPLRSQLIERGIGMVVTEAAKDLLCEKGYDEAFGARPLRRTIQTMVQDVLSEKLLRNEFHAGDTICLDREGDEIKVCAMVPVESASPAALTSPHS
ncbi:MAG: NDP-hexose 4-ketoreductase, partial [Chloroflexi bacterium]|nr:NDP-hexose 4-ketoreductase [Chloroflexota bacterium]